LKLKTHSDDYGNDTFFLLSYLGLQKVGSPAWVNVESLLT